MKEPGAMTPKQERFCEEFIIDGNATGAARRAGYSAKTAYVQGPRLLENVGVAARISELQAEVSERNKITVDSVVAMLIEDRKDAKAAGQHGPAVRCSELLGKTAGVFLDRLHLGQDEVSDEELIKGLAGDDEKKAAMLREILGRDTEFAPLRTIGPGTE